jgi:hypothetical protein
MFLKIKKPGEFASKHLTWIITGQYNHAASRKVNHSIARETHSLLRAPESTGKAETTSCCA